MLFCHSFRKFRRAGFFILLVFTFFALLDIQILESSNFIGKYLWSIIISFGAYIIVYTILQVRTNENRDRRHSQFPLSIKTISISRWSFGIIPLISAVIYLLVLQYFLGTIWQIHISRITGQLGLFTSFLAMIFLMRDLLFQYQLCN